MKKKLLRRIATVATAAVLCAGACGMFAGCSSNYPEITITYTFNGTDYEVPYKLSRVEAPNTVQHFLELVEVGYYDGLCVHDYDSNYLRTGGYKIEDGELEAVNYFEEVKRLEAEKELVFSQSVWTDDDAQTPLYTVYGEFRDNGNLPENGASYKHSYGALVMDYSNKKEYSMPVRTVRNDGGAGNDGVAYDVKPYYMNSATSLFYTFLGDASTTRDASYCVFGAVSDTSKLRALLDAIDEYISDHTDDDSDTDYSFTEVITKNVNEYEWIEELRRTDITENFNTPLQEPICIKTITIDRY